MTHPDITVELRLKELPDGAEWSARAEANGVGYNTTETEFERMMDWLGRTIPFLMGRVAVAHAQREEAR